jgi:hypothetical protein
VNAERRKVIRQLIAIVERENECTADCYYAPSLKQIWPPHVADEVHEVRKLTARARQLFGVKARRSKR